MLGAVVALGVQAPVAVAMALVAAARNLPRPFARHRNAARNHRRLLYAAGFVLATALLHAGGVTLGLLIGRLSSAYGRLGFRLSGGLVALTGGAILLHVV